MSLPTIAYLQTAAADDVITYAVPMANRKQETSDCKVSGVLAQSNHLPCPLDVRSSTVPCTGQDVLSSSLL